jgi:DNA end-binding protein Ku
MPRSIWNGTIAFATVRVPVKLYAASESKTIRFRERHGKDGAAIEHRRVCEHEDREIPFSEVVKGLQTSSGEYVVLSKEEVAAADGPAARTIEVEHFVQREQIDPLYFDHPYYLGPGSEGVQGYRLLHAAMRRSDRVGIGRFVFHNKAQLVALRALGDAIAMQTMRFADEIVPAPAPDADDGEAKLGKRERDIAMTLVQQLESKFQPQRYKDTYREAVLELIERKAKGERIEAPTQEQAAPADDLLALLQESVERGRTRRPRATRGGAKASSRTASKPAAGAAKTSRATKATGASKTASKSKAAATRASKSKAPAKPRSRGKS